MNSFLSKVKEMLIKCWWVFPIVMFVSCLASTACLDRIYTVAPEEPSFPAETISWIMDIIFWLMVICTVISWVLLFRAKKWKPFWSSLIFSLVICPIIVIPYFFIVGVKAVFAPDMSEYGKEHPIPTGLTYNIPLTAGSDSIIAIDSTKTDSYLRIYNDMQGGMYTYDFAYGPLSAGTISLRCYEAGKNEPLSEDRIKKASTVTIKTTDHFTQLVTRQPFTIYEGVWGDYYAARIEVWHTDAKTGKETKLMEKFYRVEGWMR